jgi:DNA (cytosine-5)-methyltransferase 1
MSVDSQDPLISMQELDLAKLSAKLEGMTPGEGFTFVDLFAGVGGFHAALGGLGGTCVYAVEKDPQAAAVYQRNWRMPALGDIVADTEDQMRVPDHDVLVAGFPCQPFSKSGYQRGMEETRGTLFWNICEILRVRRPSVVMLENVRNIAGPRHRHEWEVIIRSLRDLGYQVSSLPVVFSPHLLPPHLGGRPQVRERVFILAVRVDDPDLAEWEVAPAVAHRPVEGWSATDWSLEEHLPLQPEEEVRTQLSLRLNAAETSWIAAWDDFVQRLRADGASKLPGFPVWADEFVHPDVLIVPPGTPAWKANFLRKNAELYRRHQEAIDGWLQDWDHLEGFPPSRRKLEWQAQDAASLAETVLHLRPSGLRAKKASYVPALVAITQTTILGDRRRRLSTREAARLQGLPEWFDFGSQPESATYKQMGNGVNAGAAQYVFKAFVQLNAALIKGAAPGLVEAVQSAVENPDVGIERYWDSRRPVLRRPGRLEDEPTTMGAAS